MWCGLPLAVRRARQAGLASVTIPEVVTPEMKDAASGLRGQAFL